MRIHDVWRSLPEEDRRLVVDDLALMRAGQGWPRGVLEAFARAVSFRARRVAAMGSTDLAELLNRHLGRLPSAPLRALLTHLHLHVRAALLGDVYEALGVQHDGCEVSDERLARPLDEAAALAGIETLHRERSMERRRLLFCMQVMSCVTSAEWQPVIDKVCARVEALAAEQVDQDGSPVAGAQGGSEAGRDVGEEEPISVERALDVRSASGAVSGLGGAIESQSMASYPVASDADAGRLVPVPGPGHTGTVDDEVSPFDEVHAGKLPRLPAELLAPLDNPFDRLLIDTAIASATGIEGSLEADELDDLIREVISLNAKRKRSSFHRGFVDALHKEELSDRGAGDNAESRAWYVTGYILGGMRLDGAPDAVRGQFERLEPADREALLNKGAQAAGAELSRAAIVPLLKAGAIDQVQPWLEEFLPIVAHSGVLRGILAWAKDTLIHEDPEPVRRVLELVVRSRGAIERLNGPFPPDLDHDLRRRLAVCWRRAMRFPEAREEVDRLLAESPTPREHGRLLGDRVLIALGVSSIEDLALPRNDGREAFLQALAGQRELLEQAVADEQAVPSALVALALPAVADHRAPPVERSRAAALLRRALQAMNDESPQFWRGTGLLRRCRFYLTLLELREADQAMVSPAVATLHGMLEESDDLIGDLPRDLVGEAVTMAVLAEARSSPAVALIALRRRPREMIRTLDMRQLAQVGRESRQAVLDALASAVEQLSVKERWTAWEDLLRGSIEGGDQGLGAGERALDALEELADCHGRADQFLELLEDEDNWSPVWQQEDVDDARVRLLSNLGRCDEAIALLDSLAHRSLSDGDSATAELIDRMADLGAGDARLSGLRARQKSLEGKARELQLQAGFGSMAEEPAPVRVLFVGGNETQRAYEPSLRDWFEHGYPGCQLRFHFPGWSSNWGRVTDVLNSRLGEADVLVLMRFVRTGLGRAMRREAGRQGKPWVPCCGHGRDSMRRSIATAVDRARQAGRATRHGAGVAGGGLGVSGQRTS